VGINSSHPTLVIAMQFNDFKEEVISLAIQIIEQYFLSSNAYNTINSILYNLHNIIKTFLKTQAYNRAIRCIIIIIL